MLLLLSGKKLIQLVSHRVLQVGRLTIKQNKNMKLYVKARNESKEGREAVKGGNKEIVIELSRGNKKSYTIVFKEETLLVYNTLTSKILLEEREKGEKQKGKKQYKPIQFDRA